ncbi:MAG: GNAT family N-acetyltransferase [Sphingopyxis sp.]
MTIGCKYHSNFASARASAGSIIGGEEAIGNGQAGLFDRIDWFEQLHKTCLGDHQPLIFEARNALNQSAWLFLMQKGSAIFSLANYYSFWWRPIWTGNPDEHSKAALIGSILPMLKSHGPKLWLAPAPVEGGIAKLLSHALRTAGFVVDCQVSSHNHWLETQGRSFADWWALRPGALRSTVQRKSKKNMVALNVSDQFSDADWDDYEAVYRDSWKPEEGYTDFLRSWAEQEAAAGRLRLGIARIAGQPVAAQFWSCDNGVAYIHKLAHVAGHDALSPGTLLSHAMFCQAFDVDKVARIDFGTGDDGYKRDWTEQSEALMTIRAWNPRRLAAWPSLTRHYASRLAARAQGR